MPTLSPVVLTAPTVRQRRVAIEIRRLREQAGLSIPEAASKLLGIDSLSWEQFENAELRVPWVVFRRLLYALPVTDEDFRTYLLSLIVDDQEHPCDDLPGWSHEFASRRVGIVPEYRRMYAGLATGASSRLMYQSTVVPGILQTRDYAAALATQLLPADTPGVSEAIDARMGLADRLTGADPVVAHAVITEAVLRSPIGGPQMMADQYQRLLDLGTLPNVTIRILPLDSAIGGGLLPPFALLEFSRPLGNPGIASIEHVTRTQFIDNPDEIADYRAAWDRVTAAALDPAASARFIATLTHGHDPDPRTRRSAYEPTWRRAAGRGSPPADDAVEVATDYGDQRDLVAVRNSDDPDHTVVAFTHPGWSAFIADAASFSV